MFPAQNLRSPLASTCSDGLGAYPSEYNNICLKLFVHMQAKQYGEMNQMTLPYRHMVRSEANTPGLGHEATILVKHKMMTARLR